MRTLAVPVAPGRSVLVERRSVLISVLLAALVVLTGFAGLCFGNGWDRPADVWSALSGGGPIQISVTQWRMPRVVAAVVFGAGLGAAGAIFQNLTRNPLGSPDVIGLDAGAYTGVLVAMTVIGVTGEGAVMVGALIGGLSAALLIQLFAWGRSFSGLRLIVIGIAVGAVLAAVNSWLVLRAELDVAIAATFWNAGSLAGLDWVDIDTPVSLILVLLAALVVVARPMHQLAFGDDLARTTGVSMRPVQILLVGIGVTLTATVTSVAGPIVFIALAAPQIGRRLVGVAGVPLLPAALTGALLLCGSDLVAQWIFAPVALPVGVVTTAVGGAYLLWLLVKEVR
ncbi:FecCD family ABC transporter permease [Nocardioides sp. Bht2]|uniref:FecCD family ABC transporter permease n=1 Tax=Nocardioides sp. Bht2 TaxID=3392297 RepID=UPI0039B684AE